MDLNEKERSSKEYLIPLSISLLGVLVAIWFSFSHWQQNRKYAQLRSIEVEEKETVIYALDRLEINAPQILSWVGQFRDLIVKGETPCFVQQYSQSKLLVWSSQRGYVFSSDFFSTDSATQERALARVVAGFGFNLAMKTRVKNLNPSD